MMAVIKQLLDKATSDIESSTAELGRVQITGFIVHTNLCFSTYNYKANLLTLSKQKRY